jgi:hypothetical protein
MDDNVVGKFEAMQTPAQGPKVIPLAPKPFDFYRFDGLMDEFQIWRDEDNENNFLLSRNEIIEIIEGVNALRRMNSIK